MPIIYPEAGQKLSAAEKKANTKNAKLNKERHLDMGKIVHELNLDGRQEEDTEVLDPAYRPKNLESEIIRASRSREEESAADADAKAAKEEAKLKKREAKALYMQHRRAEQLENKLEER